MASSSWPDAFDMSILASDRKDPYLRLQSVSIFVRDQDASLRFYVDRLGFRLIHDERIGPGNRWIAVGPPDGTALLTLITPEAESENYTFIGKCRQVVFITEDVVAKYNEWSKQGVRFQHPPQVPMWGGVFTVFEDPDGNSFALVGFDSVTREVEAQRRAIAERMAAERRAAQEMEIAKQVQARLFPQRLPEARTLEYAGACIQARQVGGDYYDFLELGESRIGFVVGDISGKGIAAALLMANLQANLRTQFTIASAEPRRFLRSVNQLFYENTADSAYATLFFAEYDDNSQTLTYANCGHLSGLLLRSRGTLERLDSTCTVLGLFKEWDCTIETCRMFEGDTLAVYTDGVTEGTNDSGDEFGEEGLIQALSRSRELAPQRQLEAILRDIQQFGAREQQDDITLIVAKCREG